MLIPVGVLLIVACVTLMLGSPRLLKLESWQIRRPGRALVLWHAALVLGAMAGACGLGALVVGGAVARRDPSAAAPEAILVIVAWTLLLGVGGLLAFLLTTVEGLSTSLHDARGDLSAERVRVVDDSLVSLVSFASEEMMAVAVPGGRPTVYISLGLRHELPIGSWLRSSLMRWLISVVGIIGCCGWLSSTPCCFRARVPAGISNRQR